MRKEMTQPEEQEISLGMRILVEHTQQSLVKASSYRKVINTTDSFNSSYKDTSGSFSGNASGGFGLFSASVDAAFKHVISNVSSLKTLSFTEESSTTEFNPNFLQIIREVTNEAMINGEVAKTVETKIVDSTPVDIPLSQRDLQKKSEDFIKMYDDGSGSGIAFGSICSFVATRQIKLKRSNTFKPIVSPPALFRMKNRHTGFFMHSDHEGWGNLRFHGVKCNPCQVLKAEEAKFNGQDGFRFINLNSGYFIHAENQGANKANITLHPHKNDSCQIFKIVPLHDGTKVFRLQNIFSGTHIHGDNNGTGNIRCIKENYYDMCQVFYFDTDELKV